MISVIIPLYNKEHYIEQTIKSVLSQTYADFELIIVNDGSTDKSADIVKKVPDERIVYVSQSNQGVSAARNAGIKMARGEYIAFLDADDKWMPEYLEKMYLLTKKYSDYSVFCAAQKKRLISTLPLGVSIIEDHCMYNYIYFTGSLLIKKHVFQETEPFREGIQLGEDRDMWLRIGCNYPTVYLNEELVHHPYDTENNLARTIDTTKSFPYWEWYDYNYPQKSSLYKYATDEIIKNTYALLSQKRYSEAWYMYKKIKGRHSIKHRVCILLKILFKK